MIPLRTSSELKKKQKRKQKKPNNPEIETS